jgi:hypothetical protein
MQLYCAIAQASGTVSFFQVWCNIFGIRRCSSPHCVVRGGKSSGKIALFNPVSKSNAINVENKYTSPPSIANTNNINNSNGLLIVEKDQSNYQGLCFSVRALFYVFSGILKFSKCLGVDGTLYTG